MKRLTAVLTVAAALALSACGWTGTGTVTDKVDHPAYFYTTMICSYYGKYGCTVWMPLGEEQPESWSLTVQDSAGKNHNVAVSENTYQTARVGGTYTVENK